MHTKQFCTQLMKSYEAETFCSHVVTDSAAYMYLLKINSLSLNNVAMSLYNIVDCTEQFC